jgi:hypothetical protein
VVLGTRNAASFEAGVTIYAYLTRNGDDRVTSGTRTGLAATMGASPGPILRWAGFAGFGQEPIFDLPL